MKAKVEDEELCIGCEICADTCEDVFKMDGEIAVVVTDPVPVDAETSCREAAEGCPVEAIALAE